VARISSASAELQLLEALRHNRRKRTRQGRFLIEGVRSIDRAIAAGWPLHAVLTPIGVARSSWATGVLDGLDGVEHHELAPELFARLADREEPPELLLVGAIVERPLAEVPLGEDAVVVVVDRPASPGNLGTILRTSDALGAAAVVTAGHAAHLFDPRTVRASVGSLFAVPACQVDGPAEVAGWLEAWRARSALPVTVVAMDEEGDATLGRTELRRPAVLLLGTERTGLARGLRDLADVTLRIPMAGGASSLNVAVAHGIALHALTSAP
jgi:23S rRNA (uridine2479-2'-O)-methyltransferase